MESDQKGTEKEYQALYSRILVMGVAEKIKLAVSGDSAARSILVRDPNKMVAVAVLKSAKITQSEIASIAKSGSVCEEVLRAIASNEEWMKLDPIRLNLASNSKTPIPVALKVLPGLEKDDLASLATDKRIAPQVAKLARELVAQNEYKK